MFPVLSPWHTWNIFYTCDIVLVICHQYFLIPIIFTRCTPVSNWSNRPLLSGVTAVIHGCSVHALGHNLGEETGFIMATLQEGSESTRNHTRLHSWTIYCIINLIQWQPSTEGSNQQSWLSSNISMKPCKVYNKLGLQHLYPLILFIEIIAETITLQKRDVDQEWSHQGWSQSAQKGPTPLIWMFQPHRTPDWFHSCLTWEVPLHGWSEQSGVQPTFLQVTWLTQVFLGRSRHQQITTLKK